MTKRTREEGELDKQYNEFSKKVYLKSKDQRIFYVNKEQLISTSPLLQDILEDEDVVVRIAAVVGLGYLGDERALPLLEQKQLYDDGIDEFGISVRDTAIEATERIRNRL